MKTVKFLDTDKSEELRSEGKVIFPFLTEKDISSLLALFSTTHKSQPDGFYSSSHAEDKVWRKEISDQILEIIQEKLTPLFENIHMLGGAFIAKAPGSKGILPLHQDWNLVNEKEARSYNLWIPLVDVNTTNGAMRILEKSHLKQETYRGPNLPPVLYQINAEVDKHMVSLDMKAGEALLYDHALWHSSPVNQTNELRLAVVFGVVPIGADLKFYHQADDQVEEYASYPNFFFENDPKDGPKGLEKVRSFAFKSKALNLAEFQEIYLEEKANAVTMEQQKKRSFLQILGLKK